MIRVFKLNPNKNDLILRTIVSKMNPSLELVIGPMFSGKSTEIIRRIRLARIINKKVLVIKPKIDNRYDDPKNTKVSITSHAYEKEECIVLELLEEIETSIHSYNVIIVDEGQFFPDLYEFVMEAVEVLGKDVIVVGLDGDSERRPFGKILDLLPLADKVTKLTSLCKRCGDGTAAIFSACVKGQKDGQICVGGADMYEPMCRKHYVENSKH